MFILNKETKVIQECTNKDAIKCCKKDSEHYEVAATKKELLELTDSEPQKEPQKTEAGEEIPGENQKNGSEDTQEPHGGKKEEEPGREDGAATGDGKENWEEAGGTKEDWQSLPDDEKEKALNDKKVEQLREIAKAMKIPGYGNMNKGTLVAMIMNH